MPQRPIATSSRTGIKLTVPTTQFARRRHADGTVDIDSIDWVQVALKEPRSVAAWIKYLHKHENAQILTLLFEVSKILHVAAHAAMQPQWAEYVDSKLHCVIMDILCEPDMFARDEDVFKNIAYGAQHLDAIRPCGALAVQCAARGDLRIAKDFMARADKFFFAIWNKPHVVATMPYPGMDPNTFQPAPQQLREAVAIPLVFLARLYDDVYMRTMPLSSYEAHCLLYLWTYSTEKDLDEMQLEGQVMAIIYDMTKNDISKLPWFVQTVLSRHKLFPRHLLRAMCRALQDPKTTDIRGTQIIHLVTIMIRYAHDDFSEFIVPLGITEGLVPSLIIGCRRQMCSSPPAVTERFVMSAMHIMGILFRADAVRDGASKQFILCFADLNFAGVLSFGFYEAARKFDEDMLSVAIALLDAATNSSTIHGPATEQNSAFRTSTRVWHDTLNALNNISARGIQQTRTKQRAIRYWKVFGEPFGLEEGVAVTTLNVPSQLSDAHVYWLIPRVCFWNGCPCAAAHVFHPMRVCKGCYRVLYCSKLCQTRDWEAGHRSMCKETWD
ncbi:hypothetical protein BXZ70DRAFT_363960 [Cristinia sonorae]|uniref:MYND-type domain-containing protein n=1 Tax=Cristinia sonorae TaxID=1940300 RepID=A0A8K0ULJ7_9AGAR|nr:hypothetical protein BXZ70DRAFT_363960 [Cristinia sonorae]